MKDLNLCELLKDSIGETFYSPLCGNVKLINNSVHDSTCVEFKRNNGIYITFLSNGTFEDGGECVIFPSKENRDWSTYKKKSNEPEYVPFSFEDYEQLIGKPIINKESKRVLLIIGVYLNDIKTFSFGMDFKHLLSSYTFLDGSPCGKLKTK